MLLYKVYPFAELLCLNIARIRFMMTSSNGNIFHVTGLYEGNSSVTKANDAELSCFLLIAPEQTAD